MIRPVKDTDIFMIMTIYNMYIMSSTATFETNPLTVSLMAERVKAISAGHPYYVCERGGEVLGYCYAHPWKEKAAYKRTLETTVYLRPGNERKGIGSQLMRHLIEDCRQKGAHALIACITGGNKGSIIMHERLGFERVSEFKEVGKKFGKWLDVVDYELILNEK